MATHFLDLGGVMHRPFTFSWLWEFEGAAEKGKGLSFLYRLGSSNIWKPVLEFLSALRLYTEPISTSRVLGNCPCGGTHSSLLSVATGPCSDLLPRDSRQRCLRGWGVGQPGLRESGVSPLQVGTGMLRAHGFNSPTSIFMAMGDKCPFCVQWLW